MFHLPIYIYNFSAKLNIISKMCIIPQKNSAVLRAFSAVLRVTISVTQSFAEKTRRTTETKLMKKFYINLLVVAAHPVSLNNAHVRVSIRRQFYCR
jgi:hypothetical protein